MAGLSILSRYYLWIGSILVFFASCVTENEPKGTALIPGDVLPVFSIQLADGSIISTSSFKGKTGIIVFFNTSCPDCQQELPVIQQLYDIYNTDPNVLIIAIAREESKESISSYWQENNLNIPYSPQTTKEVYNLFASNVIPRIFISNGSMTITKSYDDENMPTLQEMIDAVNSIKE